MPHDEHTDVKVSVVTVVYNAVDKIAATLESVLDQRYEALEYIVVDGGSTDGTMEIINRYRDRLDIVISEKDNGIYDALNKGIALAGGEWIGIMNAGDCFASNDVLSRLFSGDKGRRDCEVVYGDAIAVDGATESYKSAPADITRLAFGPTYRHGASFVKGATHKQFLFDLSKRRQLGFALDYEQIFRMFKAGCRFEREEFPIIKYELHGVSTVSPFKCTYFNYLITHGMRCNAATKLLLLYLTLWRGAVSRIGRLLHIR